MTGERIVVDVPASDARRDRIEGQVFERLAAIRGAERADAVMPDRPRARWMPWFAVAAVAATVAIIVVSMGREDRPTSTATRSHVVTPIGGASRFTVGDAVIDAGSDTSIEVMTEPSGAITLALARGTVDCDVTPRSDRPLFRVVAADVIVEVVGTRFTVTRALSTVRVDVTRGRVRVVAGATTRFVAAGESWSTATTITAGTPAPGPAPKLEGSIDAEPTAPVIHGPDSTEDVPKPRLPSKPVPSRSSKELYEAAQRVETRDKDSAARGYRKAADGQGEWAALALYSLAELEVSRGRSDSALAAVKEYLRRFTKGANSEDAAWLRVETLRTTGKHEAARDAAADYLRGFPSGTYAKTARRLAESR